ncbi:histone acetyltransferases subunit 3-domain-containing protein [Phyllosticta citribraziliensis]|uniref:Histone acetyltransferases subunit 3-domain-containing protein n=1 Tax=Phyllosticta citribraziliensis TaxID=989973 RepID=A0ABR1M161_9PEZI
MPIHRPPSKSKTHSQSRDRRSRSRNTTPIDRQSVQPSVESTTSPSVMQNTLSHLSNPSAVFIEDIFTNGSSSQAIPSPESLHAMLEDVKSRFLPAQSLRVEANEKFMRHLMQRRKARMERQHDLDRADREAEERKHKLKIKPKKREPDEDRPLAVGAHGLARQDGTDMHKDASSTISSPISQPPPSATGTGNMDRASVSGSEDSHQPEKAPAVPAYQTFGPDPTKFDDPTIYHIREIADDTPERLKKEILGVATYPKSDLKDLTPGTPPDRDFSNPKPQTQVNANVFANYVEPYIRPLTEEDLSFLKERGDRIAPFNMPRRGPRHYKDVWADEDGAMAIDSTSDKLPPNEPRGNIEMINDEVAETDAVGPGPLVSRLLSTFRSEGRNPSDSNGTNSMTEMEIDGENPPDTAGAPSLPATHIAESNNASFKNGTTQKPDFVTMEERAMQELIHIGFLSADDKPDYDGHFDDEVAARLRYLQDELRRQSIVNGARKARLLELAQHRMAQQEYCAIEDDLNNQLNAAYLKRNRNLGKGKKNTKNRPGGAGGGSHVVQVGGGVSGGAGAGARGLGEEIRALMEKKERWTSVIGPVVDYGKAGIPRESVFDEETMKRYIEKEQEGWTEEQE